jgi:Tfp pilus assembly protein PilN
VSTLTLTASSVAAFPRVNLLPPEIEEHRRFRRVQLGLGGAVIGAVVVVGLIYTVAAGSVADAEAELGASTATRAALQQEAGKYADVPAVFAAVDTAQAQLGQAMSQEVRWSYVLNELSQETPKNVWLTGMRVQTNAGAAASGVPAGGTSGESNPLATPGIATIAFEGRARTHNDVATWLSFLGKQERYADAYLITSELEEIAKQQIASFQSSVTVTDKALANAGTETGTADTGSDTSKDGE